MKNNEIILGIVIFVIIIIIIIALIWWFLRDNNPGNKNVVITEPLAWNVVFGTASGGTDTFTGGANSYYKSRTTQSLALTVVSPSNLNIGYTFKIANNTQNTITVETDSGTTIDGSNIVNPETTAEYIWISLTEFERNIISQK